MLQRDARDQIQRRTQTLSGETRVLLRIPAHAPVAVTRLARRHRGAVVVTRIIGKSSALSTLWSWGTWFCKIVSFRKDVERAYHIRLPESSLFLMEEA